MTVQAERNVLECQSNSVMTIQNSYAKYCTVNWNIFTRQNFVIYGIIKFRINSDLLFLSYNDKYEIQ